MVHIRLMTIRYLAMLLTICLFVAFTIMIGPTLFADTHQAIEESRFSFSEFKNINNETGYDTLIVPNIVHLIRFNKTEFSFFDYVCIQAAFRNHQPRSFYIHTDAPGLQFQGKYWELIEQDVQLRSRIHILKLEPPKEIFGQKLNPKWMLYHGSDIARIRTLMKYGGIYLDNDVYVIKNLDKYRKFEIVINWDEDMNLGNQVIIANKNARFLLEWLETYREYHPELWYYNAGERPTTEILFRHPELIHRVKVLFGVDNSLSAYLYSEKKFAWRLLDTIHLMINHRHYIDPHYNETPTFNENIMKKYPYPIGEMVREIIAASGMEYLIGGLNDHNN